MGSAVALCNNLSDGARQSDKDVEKEGQNYARGGRIQKRSTVVWYFQMIGSRKKVVKCELSQLYVQSKNNIFTRREEARREYLPIQTEIEKPFCFITL